MVKCVNTRQPALPDCGISNAPESQQAAANTTKKEETEVCGWCARPAGHQSLLVLGHLGRALRCPLQTTRWREA